jgi:nicotinamidase-related amidase
MRDIISQASSPSSPVALLVVDMQQVYFESAALRERQTELLEACNQLIEAFTAREAYVLLITTSHERDQSTWTLSMIDDRQGYLFAGDKPTQLLEGLKSATLPVLKKTRDSAFFATDLAERLHILGIEEIVLAGVSTHTCIAQTAADAYAHNFRVTLAREAIASHVPKWHDWTLQLLQDEYRQAALSNTELLKGGRI